MPLLQESDFLRDIAKHKIAVNLDNAPYRHIRAGAPGTGNQWFEIVTWPGSLAYTGDMGTFLFRRIDDMFQFFRDARAEGEPLRINPSYWAEKLEAVEAHSSHPGHTQFSVEKLRARIEEEVKQWVEDGDLGEQVERELRREIDMCVYSNLQEESAERSRAAVADFSFQIAGRRYEFQDSWEWNTEEYTTYFLWCLYAIVWTIRKYDLHCAIHVTAVVGA